MIKILMIALLILCSRVSTACQTSSTQEILFSKASYSLATNPTFDANINAILEDSSGNVFQIGRFWESSKGTIVRKVDYSGVEQWIWTYPRDYHMNSGGVTLSYDESKVVFVGGFDSSDKYTYFEIDTGSGALETMTESDSIYGFAYYGTTIPQNAVTPSKKYLYVGIEMDSSGWKRGIAKHSIGSSTTVDYTFFRSEYEVTRPYSLLAISDENILTGGVCSTTAITDSI